MSTYKNLSASAEVKSTGGRLKGMYVNSTNAGTIKFNDGDSGTASAGVKATGTITGTGVFSNGEEVVVDTVTYTMVTALTALPGISTNQVLIGASLAASLDNLKSAINGSAGEGTTYGYGTVAHPTVTATTNTDTTQVVEAIAVGTSGNSIATTTDGANASWGAATLENGVDYNYLMNNTITPAVGYHDLGDAAFANGLYATIGGTALDVTLYYE